MKQYLTSEQATKLIELGFEKPKNERWLLDAANDQNIVMWQGYSIGELIEMLGFHLSSIRYIGIVWCVNAKGIERRSEELIDTLYEQIIKLKEDGVI